MNKRLTREVSVLILSFHSQISKDVIRNLLHKRDLHVHFVGALGIGMRGLMTLSSELGISVTGSDRAAADEGSFIEGIEVLKRGEEAVAHADLVVYSLALDGDHPELKLSRGLEIPTVSRAEYLGVIMEWFKCRVGISGSHGKSTTTAMLGEIFSHSDKAFATLCGAPLSESGSPVLVRGGDYLIYEACEYKDSFLHFSPTVSVFTSLELDHTDYFKSLSQLRDSFLRAINLASLSIINIDDENLRQILPRVEKRCITFGENVAADYRITAISHVGGRYSFTLRYSGGELLIVLGIIGRHNVYNAAAAAVCALELGFSRECVASALADFRGIERRLEVIGTYKGEHVYYDYAHHPTEILRAIEAVRECEGAKITVIFRPHTYSRTAAFLDEFAAALSGADRVVLLEISAIRENNELGISSAHLRDKIGDKAFFVSEANASGLILEDSTVIIMGAASVDGLVREIRENGERRS